MVLHNSTPKLRHLLAVGVSSYAYSLSMSLPGVAQDLNRFEKIMTNYLGNIRLATNVMLEGREAMRDVILKSIQKISQKAILDDQVIVYFSGHAKLDHETDVVYFLPCDATFETAITQGISMNEMASLLSAIRASEVVMIFDFCYSGSFVEAVGKHLSSFLLRDRNCCAIAACYKRDEVLDFDDGGFLIPSIAPALEGKECVQNQDGWISIQAAFQNAEEKLSSLAPSIRHYQTLQMVHGGRIIYITCLPEPKFNQVTNLSGALIEIRIALLKSKSAKDLWTLKFKIEETLEKYPKNAEALILRNDIEKAIARDSVKLV